MIVEWAIVMLLYKPDGETDSTSRRGFESKEQCEEALKRDLKSTFRGLPAVKGHCIDCPPRPAGLPVPEPKKGATST